MATSTTTGAAVAAAPRRCFLGRPELYKPAFGIDRCDLCGEVGELAPVVIEPAHSRVINGKKVWRTDRIAYACKRHRGEDAVGPPITPPNLTTLRGTTKLRPQKEALFDDLSLKRGGRR